MQLNVNVIPVSRCSTVKIFDGYNVDGKILFLSLPISLFIFCRSSCNTGAVLVTPLNITPLNSFSFPIIFYI